MTYFKFNNKFCKQKPGLPIGNPFSGVLANLFLEFLESSSFKYRLPSNTTYSRYIDTKQSDGEVPVMLELWGMQSNPLWPSLSVPLWSEVVAPDRVLSLG